jgi:DNA polymerase-3 subunit gamma/tau
MSLYNKYRPNSFEAVKGNKDIISALESMLKNPNKSPHSFLFHGPTGCGKTTFARIIGNKLNITSNDLTEVDSADFRGIDTIREIRKNCMFKPMESPFRMFILDEVHQLSKDAQSALLKILEDTPKHVFFVLCTTDPVKLLPTVRNRCSQFQVKQLTDNEMKVLIKQTARHEGVTLAKEVVEQIIMDSQGISRLGLTILEQVLNTPPEKQLEAAKQTALEQSESIELCRALISNSNWKKVSSILERLKQQEAESIRRHVLGYAQAVLLKSDNPKAGLIIEEFLEPTYNSGFAQIVYACYSVIKNS